MYAEDVKKYLRSIAKKEKAEILQRFFKTGPGQYGEGDIFIGIMVPQARKAVALFSDLPYSEIKKLLSSQIHEERLVALLILVRRFHKGSETDRKRIYELYLKSTRWINNWDLVDLSSHHIVGAYLLDKPEGPLFKLARSTDLWEKRISIVSTYAFIRANRFDETIKIAGILLHDEHDLIHKAVGWMLREVGKRDMAIEEKFLKKHYRHMPRTMLRYAIERFPEPLRLKYLAK